MRAESGVVVNGAELGQAVSVGGHSLPVQSHGFQEPA